MLFSYTLKTRNTVVQLIIGLLGVLVTAWLCYQFRSQLDYPGTAIILLFVTGVFAVTCKIIPVLSTALLAALVLNYFFIPPQFTFHISDSKDVLLFVIFLLVAVINAILNYRLRTLQRISSEKEEREKSIKLYQTVFSSLSHELQTPLSTIVAATDTLQQQANLLSPNQTSVLLEQIQNSGLRLHDQVNNLLNMNRMENGMLHPKLDWVDLYDILHQAVEFTEHNGIQIIDTASLPIVYLDGGLLKQIIQNLVKNAIQHTPQGTHVTLTPQILPNSELQISVQDDGPGVPTASLPFLFDKFYRVPYSIPGGTGLGLSIVKGYVDAMGGELRAENLSPNGFKIVLQLPVQWSDINALSHE